MKKYKHNENSLISKVKAMGVKTFIGIVLLAAADCFVIAAPFYLKSMVPNLQIYLNVKESDISTMTSIIGWVVLLTQLPGGWLADKLSSKKMLSIAVIMTGLITIWFGTLIIYSRGMEYENLKLQYYAIFALWGVSSTPLFWTPLTKLISQQGNKDNQGLVYGLQGSINGIFGLIFVFGIGTLVTQIIKNDPSNQNITTTGNLNVAPFAIYVYIFAGILMVVGFLAWFFIVEKPTNEKFGISVKSFSRVMMDWKIWALSIFLMGMYMFQSVFAYYFNQMLANVVKIPELTLTIISGLRLYGLRFLTSGFIGKKSDSFKSLTLILLISLVVGFVLAIVFILIPGISSNPLENSFLLLGDSYKLFASILMCSLFIITSLLSWVMVTLRYAQLAEVSVPKNGYASASALMSFVGFSTDAWFYQIASGVAKNYTNADESISQTGYQIILLIAIGVAFIGLVAGFAVCWHNTKLLKPYNIRYYRWRTLNNE